MARKKRKTTVLDGIVGKIEIDLEEWANVLLVLEDWGWKPEQSRIWYLARELTVSDADAANLARAGDGILAKALEDPSSVYPCRADMAKLYLVTELCRSGGFRIHP